MSFDPDEVQSALRKWAREISRTSIRKTVFAHAQDDH